jgi:hypothetical protein
MVLGLVCMLVLEQVRRMELVYKKEQVCILGFLGT